MLIDQYQIQQTIKRYEERAAQRTRNERLIKDGKLLSVDTPDRVEKFLKRRGLSVNIDGGISSERLSAVMAGEVADLPPEIALERYLGTNDLMGIAFLEEGLRVARTTARILVNDGTGRLVGYGTGFMVSPRLLMTNQHVLTDIGVARRSGAEFDYQRRANGSLVASTTFELDPATFFYVDRELDYAVVAVRTESTGGRRLEEFGYNLLSEEEGKAIAAQWANIVQHPGGEPKQVSLRENQIIDVLPNFLHYRSDTAQGSSGSIVCNDRWEVVALHHSGVPARVDGKIMAVDGTVWRPAMGDDRIKWIANEGVRISRIIAHLRSELKTDAHRTLFSEMLVSGTEVQPTVASAASSSGAGSPLAGATAQVAPDGTATWNIPLRVSINVGPAGMPVDRRASDQSVGGGNVGRRLDDPRTSVDAAAAAKSPNEVLAAAEANFKRSANVLGVRLGFAFRDGRITSERCLVVTVRRKVSRAELRTAGIDELPEIYMGLKVQVSDPTIQELLSINSGFAASEALALNGDIAALEITYKPPANIGLKRVKQKMTVTAHTSPDVGWAQLQPFLLGAKKSLVVGMYDFGAPHILEALEALAKKRTFKSMTLTLQPGQSVGSGTKADDLKDAVVVERLEEALGTKFQNAWIKIGAVNGWVASSYHIKVAVRDGEAFWLSSGNWQSSNQPNATPIKKPWDRSFLTRYNREWHAIVEHPGLAEEFERYLLHDFANNRDGSEEAMLLPDLMVPEEAFAMSAAERSRAFQYFEPFHANRVFDVQPLLTPDEDSYYDHVLALIRGARSELLIQNQTFNAPKQNQEKLRGLLSAVRAKQREGVDVKIIFRILMKADARKNLEALQEFGFDMDSIKVQKNCHTKGIIVDRQNVLLGSQNISEQGVSLNRDASLLFFDRQLAEYFAKIFEHDWNNLASDSIDIAPSGAELATTAAEEVAGYTTISVEEYLESL